MISQIAPRKIISNYSCLFNYMYDDISLNFKIINTNAKYHVSVKLAVEP